MLVEDLVVLMVEMVLEVCMGVGSGIGRGDDFRQAKSRCEVGAEAGATIGVGVLGTTTSSLLPAEMYANSSVVEEGIKLSERRCFFFGEISGRVGNC